MHLERKMISFWGRRPRTQETQSLHRPQEGLETYFTLTGCSLSAEMMLRDRQGTRNGKIPQHIHRLFVNQLEHRISAPSCNGDCKGGSSHLSFFFFQGINIFNIRILNLNVKDNVFIIRTIMTKSGSDLMEHICHPSI